MAMWPNESPDIKVSHWEDKLIKWLTGLSADGKKHWRWPTLAADVPVKLSSAFTHSLAMCAAKLLATLEGILIGFKH